MSRVQSGKHGCRIPGDDGQEGSVRGLRGAPSTFPVLDRIQAEAECIGKAGLGHFQALPDALDVDLGRQADLIASRLLDRKASTSPSPVIISSNMVVIAYLTHCPLQWTLFVKRGTVC